ncbi:MAG: phosphomannomutase [Boseongicola sp.]|nr:MAG: phosphomannomutase [Boseongicola sp.]
MTSNPTNRCFKKYDIRGVFGENLTTIVAYDIGRALAQTLEARKIVVGFDCRLSSPDLSEALCNGICAQGCDVAHLGLSGTEEVYFATDALAADGGVQITASHNPADQNGFKVIGPQARPLSAEEFTRLKVLASGTFFKNHLPKLGATLEISTRREYVDRVLAITGFARTTSKKVVVNAGNGVVGPAADAIIAELANRGCTPEIIKMAWEPDGTFPFGVPNPLLKSNQEITANAVKSAGADFGVAWDADFDRCFFFDETGKFVSGELAVALLARRLLSHHKGATAVYDPRAVLCIENSIKKANGRGVIAKVGHVHQKRTMREADAIYGGELSGHHYFREFMCCDSGMIPWLVVLRMLIETGKPLSELVDEVSLGFRSSGELNYQCADSKSLIDKLNEDKSFSDAGRSWVDGLSLDFKSWRLNVRSSSTENLLRLNIEAAGSEDLLQERIREVVALFVSNGARPHVS